MLVRKLVGNNVMQVWEIFNKKKREIVIKRGLFFSFSCLLFTNLNKGTINERDGIDQLFEEGSQHSQVNNILQFLQGSSC